MASMAKKRAKKKAIKVKVKREIPQSTIVSSYKAILKFNGEEYVTFGSTPLEAFTRLKVSQQMVKTKVLLILERDNLRAEQIFFSLQLRRFLMTRIAKEIWAKRMEVKLRPYA